MIPHLESCHTLDLNEEHMKLTKSESSRINGAKSRGPKTARGIRPGSHW